MRQKNGYLVYLITLTIRFPTNQTYSYKTTTVLLFLFRFGTIQCLSYNTTLLGMSKSGMKFCHIERLL